MTRIQNSLLAIAFRINRLGRNGLYESELGTELAADNHLRALYKLKIGWRSSGGIESNETLMSCSAAQQLSVDKQQVQSKRKILIVYLSRTNNTKAVAEFIRNEVGGTLVPIEIEKPYPADYQTNVYQVANENETGFLPPLNTKVDSTEKYDVIFLDFHLRGCSCLLR